MRTGLVVVAAVVALAAACGDDDSTVSAGDPDELTGIEWQIDGTSQDGEDLTIPEDGDAVIRFDDDGQVSGTVCNHFGGSADIGEGTLRFGEEIAMTSMACLDPDVTALEEAVSELLYGRDATWAVDDGTLTLTGSGVTVQATERADLFPTPDLVVLASSSPDETAQWQYGYTEQADSAYRYFLSFEGRDEPGEAFGSAGMAVDPEVPFDAMWVTVDDRLFPFGTLPDGTVDARFDPEGSGSAVELDVYELPDGRMVFGQPVDASLGTVQALAADGSVIDTSRRLGDP